MSNPEDARKLLHIFECSVRGMEINYKEMGGDPKETENDYKTVFKKFVAELEFLSEQFASSKWPAPFKVKLGRTMVVYPYNLDASEKDSLRFSPHCMACGKAEHTNFKGVSAFGFCPKIPIDRKPFTSMENLADDYANYIDSYNAVLKDSKYLFLPKHAMHPQDGGVITAGDTCTKRIFMYRMANNFIFDYMFIAHEYLQDRCTGGRRLSPNKLYFCEDEDCNRLVDSFTMLKTWASSERVDVQPGQLALDDSYIKAVRSIRYHTVYKGLKGPTRLADASEMLGILAKKQWGPGGSPYVLKKGTSRARVPPPVEISSTEKSLQPSGIIDALKGHLQETYALASDVGDSGSSVGEQPIATGLATCAAKGSGEKGAGEKMAAAFDDKSSQGSAAAGASAWKAMSSERLPANPAEQSTAESSNPPPEKPAEKPAEQPTAESSNPPPEKPAEQLSAKPAGNANRRAPRKQTESKADDNRKRKVGDVDDEKGELVIKLKKIQNDLIQGGKYDDAITVIKAIKEMEDPIKP